MAVAGAAAGAGVGSTAGGTPTAAAKDADAFADEGASLGSWRSPETSLRKLSKKYQSNLKPRSERVQEVLGNLPMLLVDDSVSILKLTKKAIQNECAHIRSVRPTFLCSHHRIICTCTLS